MFNNLLNIPIISWHFTSPKNVMRTLSAHTGVIRITCVNISKNFQQALLLSAVLNGGIIHKTIVARMTAGWKVSSSRKFAELMQRQSRQFGRSY